MDRQTHNTLCGELWWHTSDKKNRTTMFRRSDGKFWLCDGLRVFP